MALCAVSSCADLGLSDGVETTGIERTTLDSATVLVADSTDHRFESLPDATEMLVYHDSILIASNSKPEYGEPLISLYDMNDNMRRLVNYIPQGYGIDEMMACRIAIAGDDLFVHDSYYTGSYCSISLKKPLPHARDLHLSYSGVQQRGVAVAPCKNGLLVENPQCYSNEQANIHNDVPRLLYYEQGRCLTPQGNTAYQVADINTGADIHNNPARNRVCFVSHRQPIVEFYDDSIHLIRSLTLPSDGKQKLHFMAPQTTMRQKRSHSEGSRGITATFDKTRRVVGAGSQLHAFLCSAADEEHIYLAYCGKLFGYSYHTFPTYILVLDWDGNLVGTYRFNRWVQSISPSSEKGTFYLTVFADGDYHSSRMKLIKAESY